MSKNQLTILQLYSQDMNIYGDNGNVLVLKKRAEWHGYQTLVIEYNPGDTLPDNVDIIIGGGGQDSGQDKIQNDLLSIGPKLIDLAERDTPMLVICGLYQLFGNFFRTQDGHVIDGIGLLDTNDAGIHHVTGALRHIIRRAILAAIEILHPQRRHQVFQRLDFLRRRQVADNRGHAVGVRGHGGYSAGRTRSCLSRTFWQYSRNDISIIACVVCPVIFLTLRTIREKSLPTRATRCTSRFMHAPKE